ncbi:MAG: hypothetical protein WBD10_09855 [Acidobacteriaceae bacterium]
MTCQDVRPDTPSHTKGTHKGEEWAQKSPEPGREGKSATARSSTSINPKARGPIDSRMPNMPPA